MEKITKKIILKSAARLVETHGVNGVSIADVGKSLGVSHAAIYKHFKNKQDLWTSLALQWLDKVLIDIFPFKIKGNPSQRTIAHDWLWNFSKGKMDAYFEDPEMFKLYTEYIDANPEVLATHISNLIESFKTATNFRNTKEVAAILQAFAVFNTPSFASTWGEQSQAEFETVWDLVKNNFND